MAADDSSAIENDDVIAPEAAYASKIMGQEPGRTFIPIPEHHQDSLSKGSAERLIRKVKEVLKKDPQKVANLKKIYQIQIPPSDTYMRERLV